MNPMLRSALLDLAIAAGVLVAMALAVIMLSSALWLCFGNLSF